VSADATAGAAVSSTAASDTHRPIRLNTRPASSR
jgi:hypothetical protein